MASVEGALGKRERSIKHCLVICRGKAKKETMTRKDNSRECRLYRYRHFNLFDQICQDHLATLKSLDSGAIGQTVFLILMSFIRPNSSHTNTIKWSITVCAPHIPRLRSGCFQDVPTSLLSFSTKLTVQEHRNFSAFPLQGMAV